jgi:Zn-dependent peptidase ImmA (M78 family)
MLRSYQEAQGNYFEEIETAVEGFLENHGWDQPGSIDKAQLTKVLADEFDLVVDEKTMDSYEDLQSFRSIWIEGQPQTLLINGKLSTEQKVFQMGREVAYRLLGLKERGITSSRSDATSFEQVLNDFKASYFAGAMLIPQQHLLSDLRELFRRETWDGEAFLRIKQRYGITPEMFLYRLTQIIPHHFGLKQYYFLRFNNPVASRRYQLTKQFNMSPVLFPTGIEQDEHYCRRWAAVDILRQLEAEQRDHNDDAPVVGAQVSRFIHGDADYFVISMARPLALRSGTNTSVTLGFRITDRFKSAVKFWKDPSVAHKLINETCERCGLSELECGDRIAAPQPEKQKDFQDPRKLALARLLESFSSSGPSA